MQEISHITTHINSNPYELYIQRVMKKEYFIVNYKADN